MESQRMGQHCQGLSFLKYAHLSLIVTFSPAFTDICFHFEDDVFLMGEKIKLIANGR